MPSKCKSGISGNFGMLLQLFNFIIANCYLCLIYNLNLIISMQAQKIIQVCLRAICDFSHLMEALECMRGDYFIYFRQPLHQDLQKQIRAALICGQFLSKAVRIKQHSVYYLSTWIP